MAAHLYWRVNILGNAAGNYCGFAEVSMADTVGGQNLLTGGTASASDSYSANPPIDALDGNAATSWFSNGPSSGWWQYEFASPVDIAEVKITADSNGAISNRSPSNWQLQYSDDGVTFASASDTITSQPWTAGMTQTFEFAPYVAPLPGQHRYWRINASTDVPPYYFSIIEIEMASESGGENILRSGSASMGSSRWGTVASAACDGDVATSWSCGQMAPGWWAYDFGAGNAQNVQEVWLLSGGSGPTAFNLDFSDDNVTWVTKQSFTAAAWGWLAQVFTVEGAPIAVPKAKLPHRFWKMSIYGPVQTYISIAELVMAEKVAGPNLLPSAVVTCPSGTTQGALANLFDGDVNSSWMALIGQPSLYVDFGVSRKYSVNQVSINVQNPTNGLGAFMMSFSDDGNLWQRAAEFLCDPWVGGVTQMFTLPIGITPPPSTRRRRPVVMMN